MKKLIPKYLLSLLKYLRSTNLEYCAAEWDDALHSKCSLGWDSAAISSEELQKWEKFCSNLENAGPLGFSHESHDLSVVDEVSFHNIHITFAYVLALASHLKTKLSILDWGGGLGHYYQLGKAVVPNVEFDFHVKEVPSMVEIGRRLNKDIHWYTDDDCLEEKYDLVIVSSSLQYIKNWQYVLEKLSDATKEYLLLMRLPVVNNHSFLAIQTVNTSKILHRQLSKRDLLSIPCKQGLSLMREFIVGYKPYIRNAPEQCVINSWLFKRKING